MKKRIQAMLAQMGFCSRRTAEEWIEAGRVTVNGQTAVIGMSADDETDEIAVDGKTAKCLYEEKVYVMLNKPVGYVTTLSDERDRKTVADLVKDTGVRLYPVGRLDLNSDGLIIMTNDGELTNGLTHPKHEVEKKYVAVVRGDILGSVNKLSKPMVIEGYEIRPAKVSVLKLAPGGGRIQIVIHEGRNRQIRKMCALCGLEVDKLHRVAIGDLQLGTLELGRWRYLDNSEVGYLKKIAGI